MSMIAMAAPAPHSSFSREYPWDGPRIVTENAPRQTEKIALPSIRQAFPELQLRIPSPQDSLARTPSATTSPTTALTVARTPPEYIHSPNSNKRRRYSIEDAANIERASRVPRLYSSQSSVPAARQPSPTMPPRTPASDSWGGSARTSPFLPSGAMPAMHSPMAPEGADRSRERRPTLPCLTLPHIAYEREPQPMPRVAGHPSQEDYPPPQRPMPLSAGPTLEAPPTQFRHNPFSYQYHHPSRVQSLSVGSIHPFDRSPYAAGGYTAHHYHDFVRYGDVGTAGMAGDNKQRKRRGNLPKETTDKLRAWFVGHLHHPYPTEDEKQELMRQTGLQMNQISNWFINARRRQLPTMINNARAESDAANSARGVNENKPATTATNLSDGEAGSFDDDLRLQRQRSGHVKRGSI
ncbi:hypothetical protein jhhlp_000905 [Lomentospora prolificans]|uniref:Homeobox domain-containing protein n=1 Tax=Lomentospora prolificans TaxID=41688 RepID=A0A2N3NJT8_9PEZI|nr:hypothetical protein jhhlp_000905 [Lomentospora prolificans]